MKKKNGSLRSSHPIWVRTCVAALGLGAAAAGMAQSVIIAPPTLPESLPGNSQSSDSSGESGDSGSGPSGSVRQPFRWRKLIFHPRASYDFLYGSGIPSQTNHTTSTTIQTLSPGVMMELGEHWSLDYSTRITLYSSSEFQNALNHAFSLRGHTSYGDWSYGLGLGLSITSDPSTETGKQTDQQGYSLSLNASHQLNGKLSLDLSGALSFSSADGFNSARDYSTTDWLNYQLSSTLGFGLGLGFGYNDATLSSDTMHEEVLVRVVWQIINRVSFSLHGGPEFRQFLDSQKSTLISGTFGGSLSYSMTRATSLSLNANRSIAPSLFKNQLTTSTSYSVSVSQRIFSRYFAALSGGYTFTDYQSTETDSGVGRSDSTRFLSINLGTSFMKRGTASIFYSLNENLTNQKGFAYVSDQVGATVSYSY